MLALLGCRLLSGLTLTKSLDISMQVQRDLIKFLQSPENTDQTGRCASQCPENTARSGWYANRSLLKKSKKIKKSFFQDNFYRFYDFYFSILYFCLYRLRSLRQISRIYISCPAKSYFLSPVRRKVQSKCKAPYNALLKFSKRGSKRSTLGIILVKWGGAQIMSHKILVYRGGTQIGTFWILQNLIKVHFYRYFLEILTFLFFDFIFLLI